MTNHTKLYSLCDHGPQEHSTNQHGTICCVCGQRAYEIPDELMVKLLKHNQTQEMEILKYKNNDLQRIINELSTVNSNSQKQLTFAAFRKLSLARSAEKFHINIDEWSPTDWGCALAGEVGEMLNLVKKLRRGDPVVIADIADEAGDVVAYLDLLCARLGFSLGLAVSEKFNLVSERVGSVYKFIGISE